MSFIILLRDLPAQVLKTFAELQTGILRRDAEWADLATAEKDIDKNRLVLKRRNETRYSAKVR